MKSLLICALVVAAALSGCATVKTEVRASGAPKLSAAIAGERSYAFERAPSQQANGNTIDAQYEALVRDKFAQYQFVEAPALSARYLVSIAYDTRAAAVDIDTGPCAASCVEIVAPAAAGRHGYRHALTLRFFDRRVNREIYKVTAIRHDSDADPLHAMPYLTESALAKLPYDSDGDWRVKLHTIDAGEAGKHTPVVLSIEAGEH